MELSDNFGEKPIFTFKRSALSKIQKSHQETWYDFSHFLWELGVAISPAGGIEGTLHPSSDIPRALPSPGPRLSPLREGREHPIKRFGPSRFLSAASTFLVERRSGHAYPRPP